MRRFLTALLAICVLCSFIPGFALASDTLTEEEYLPLEALPEESLQLEELPVTEDELNEEAVFAEELIEMEAEQETSDDSRLLLEALEEIEAYAYSAPVITVPARIVAPPTAQDIKKDQMLVKYDFFTQDFVTGFNNTSVLNVIYGDLIISIYYNRDGSRSLVQISTSTTKTSNGKNLSYSIYPRRGLNIKEYFRNDYEPEVHGILSDSRESITYRFVYPEGAQAGGYLKYITSNDRNTGSSTEYVYFQDDGWYIYKNNEYTPAGKGIQTDLIACPVIKIADETLVLWSDSPAPPSPPVDTNIYNFVNRCYSEALGRTDAEIRADAEGVMYWYNNLKNKLISADYVGYYFVFSPEGSQKGQSNNSFVTMLYRLYMNRIPDSGGLNYWDTLLNNGTLTRENVNWWFCESDEWQGIKASYGMK